MIPQIKEINFPEYATLHQATVTLQEMGDRTITTQVRIDGDVVPSFDGWELEFKGERFVLSIKDPQAAKDNTTKNSLVDLTFHSWAALQLKRYFFMEMTSVSTGTAIANSYNASLKLSLGDFIEAFDRVLDYYFGGKISIQLYPQSVYSSETSIFEINNTYIWDVLTKIYEVYHVRWFIDQDGLGNYIIKVDYPAEEIDDHDFEYGYKGGLLRFERHVQEEDITNILLGRGGTKNLPYRYFKEVDFFNDTFPADPDAIPELANIYFDRLRDANFRSYVQGWKAKTEGGYDESRATTDWAYRLGYSDTKFRPTEYVKDDESIAKYGEHWGALDDNDDIYPTIQGVSVDPYGRIDEVIDVSPIITDDIDAMAENAAIWYNVEGLHTITDTVPAGESREFVIRGGSFSVPSEAGKNLRGNLNWTYFSNFRTETDPEALSTAVYVDPTRSYITVEGTGEGGSDSASIAGLLPGTYSYEIHLFVVNDSGSDATGTFGVNELKLTVADRDQGLWQPTFDIWVKNIWGSQRLENETDEEYSYRVWRPILGDQFQNKAAVAFSSGWLSISDDYQFYIASYPVPDQTKEYNNVRSEWRITLRKSDAEYQATGLYIPNASTGGRAVPGDYFYFLGVDMPFQYVEWAEERLRDYKLANLGNLSEINPTWVINIDKVRVNTLEEEDYETTLADRLIAGGRIRTKDKRFTNGNVLTLYVQSITYTWNEPTENNPYIVPDIEVILTDKPVAVEGAIDKVQGEVNVLQTQFANLADLESSIKKVGGMMFLKKTGESDRSYSPTKFNSSVNSGDFRQGDVGGRGWGIYNDGAGSSVYEVDKLIVRKEMFVNSLVVNQIEYVGGKQITSAASIHCTGVFEDDQAYECHFDQKHGTVKNLFKVGDIAMGQVFSADNLELKYYRRKVIEVGVDYIRLAKFNPDPIPTKVIGVDEETGEEIVEPLLEVDGTGVPSEGDVIIQYGSLTDPNRRFVIIRDVIGGGYDRMLSDLDHAGAAGKEYSFTGRQSGQNPRWFIGDKDAKQFAEYKDGILTISGIFNVVGDQGQSTPINQYLDDINTQFQVIQTQIDGAIETWFASGVPTLENFPAVNWPLDTDKNIHLGDLYYNQDTGKAYRFQLENGVYVWREITDTDIQSALDAANAARQAAGHAQADADAAKARLDSWASDGVISPTEKQSIKDEIARVDSDYNMINRSYTLYKLGTPTAYNTAYAAYREQLVALSQDSPENIAIPATFATNQGTYYTERTSCLNRINQAILDGIEELSREIAGYEYLKEALKGSTTIQGGLILSSTIQLGKTENDAFKVYSGINGIPVDGKLGGGIAAWFGGDMIDHEEEPEKTGYAKTIFRHDGSGYLASGNISWGPTGAGQIPGISWTADGKVILSNDVYLEGGTEQIISLINAVNKFASFFEEDANGDIRTRNNRGLYSMSFVSAGGASGTSGGGSNVNVLRAWDSSEYAPTDETQVLGSNLGWDLNTRVSALQNAGYITANEVDSKLAHLDLSGSYLPLSGGTMTNTNLVTNLNADLLDGKQGTSYRDKAVYSFTNYRASGYYKISINSKAGRMYMIRARMYCNYSSDEICVSGYNYGSTKKWYSADAWAYNIVSRTELEVIFGHDGDNEVWFAVPSVGYFSIDLSDVFNAWQGGNDWSASDLFTVSYVETRESLGNIDKTVVCSRPWRYNERVNEAVTSGKLKDFEVNVRRPSGNLMYGDGCLRYFLATSAMKDTGRPGHDGHILHLSWDNTGNWDTQLYVTNASVVSPSYGIKYRNQNGSSAWGDWISVWDSNNLTGSALAGIVDNTIDWTAKTLTLALESSDWNFGILDQKIRFLRCGGTAATGAPGAYFSGLSAIARTGFQLVTYEGAYYPNLRYRKLDGNGTWSDWYTLAFTSDNVASANKLYTPRSIWGQSFDGTGDVTGGMSNVGNITPISTDSYNLGSSTLYWNFLYVKGGNVKSGFVFGDGENEAYFGAASGGLGSSYTGGLMLAYGDNPLYFYTNSLRRAVVTGSGNVGIGTSTPSARLDVSGGFRTIQPDNSETFVAKFLAYPTSPYGIIISSAPNGTMSLQSQREASDSQVFGLTLNPLGGNVGIGTGKETNPAEKLTVAGNIAPSVTNIHNLGTASLIWNNLYVNNIKIGSATISWDATNNALKVDTPLYSTSWIAAGGVNSQDGGGSNVNVLRAWDSSEYAPTDETQVLGSNLGWDLDTRVSALQNAGYITANEVDSKLANLDLSGSYVKVNKYSGTAPFTTREPSFNALFISQAASEDCIKRGTGDQGVIVLPTWRGNTDSNYYTIEIGFVYDSNRPYTRINHSGTKTAWMPLAFQSDLSNYATTSQLSGYLPLTGGTLTGNLTAPTFIKSGSSDSDVLLGGGGAKAISQFVTLDKKYQMPTNPFGGSPTAIQQNLTNDGMYAASRRFNVTLTGIIGDKNKLFDGSYETHCDIAAGGTGTILIESDTSLFGVYSYGYTFISFYYNRIPESVSMRLYGNRGGTVGWYDADPATFYYGSSSAIANVTYSIYNSNTYSVSKIEITIKAKANTESYIAQVDHMFTRGETKYLSAVTKFPVKQDLWGPVEINNTLSVTGNTTIGGTLSVGSSSANKATTLYGTLTASGSATAARFITSGGTSSQFVKGDGSLDSTAYATAASVTTLQGYFDSGGNAKSALKLATARSIWGQNFDGSGDISGSISKATSIEFDGGSSTSGNGGFIDFHYNASADDYTSRIIESANGLLNINYAIYANLRGNVGIGLSTPSEKLEVNGKIKSTSFVTSGGTSSQFVKGDGSLDSTAYATAASVTTLQGYFDTSGNAKTALKLASSVDLWGQSFDGSDEVNGMITIYNGLKIGKATDVIGSTVGYGGAISTIGSNPLYLGTNGDRNMVITSAGNVGIGTNSPSDKLHVNGNIKAAGTLTGVTSISMGGALSGATSISMNGAISGVTNLNSLVYLGSNAVGIGVSSPAYSLDVSGSARYTGSLYVAQKIYLDTGGNYYIELRNVGTSSSPVWALYTNAPIVSSSFISAGGVSSTSN